MGLVPSTLLGPEEAAAAKRAFSNGPAEPPPDGGLVRCGSVRILRTAQWTRASSVLNLIREVLSADNLHAVVHSFVSSL